MTKDFLEKVEEIKKIASLNGYIKKETINEILKDSNQYSYDEVIAHLQKDELLVIEDIDSDDYNEKAEIDLNEFEELQSHSYHNDAVRLYLHEIGQISLLTYEQEVEYGKLNLEANELKEYLKFAEENNIALTNSARRDIEQKIFDGEVARNILIESNLRLVVPNAKRYLGSGLSFLDLIQEGNMGLIKAVNKFDPTKGFKFSTYATWWIKQSISRAIADQGRMIRLPVHLHDAINKINRAKRILSQKYNREPTSIELANATSMDVTKVEYLLNVSLDTVSLDKTVSEDDDTTTIDFVKDTSILDPFNYSENKINKEAINRLLSSLTPREEKVIRMRYGFDDNLPKTLEEVGLEFGVTRERIRQIESKAIRRLRHPARIKQLRELKEV